MDKEKFKIFSDKILRQLTKWTELYTGKKVSGQFVLEWNGLDKNKYSDRETILEQLTSKIFLDTDKIYPCVDILVSDINAVGTISIRVTITGFEPRPFQNNYLDRPGPYIFMIKSELINPKLDTKSTDFKNYLTKIYSSDN